MGRRIRPNLPGATFHLTARVHGGERLFSGLQKIIVGILLAEAQRASTRIAAYAVMTNHLHVLAIQGTRGLPMFMQPAMRRIAVLVQGVYDRRGRIFEAPYADQVCTDASYFRNVVAYIHLNPVRAGICADPAAYPYSSHAAYVLPHPTDRSFLCVEFERSLRAFAPRPDSDLAQCRTHYMNFLEWRIQADQCAAVDPQNPHAAAALPAPDCFGGDVLWAREAVAGNVVQFNRPRWPRRPAEDMSTIARRVTAGMAHPMTLEALRSGSRLPLIVHARRHAIAHCLAGGHRPAQIARYFRVSTSTVSRVASALRKRPGL